MSQYQQYPPSQYPPPGKRPIGRWIALGCGVIVIGLIGFIAFIVFVVGAAMRSSDPYKEATRRAQSDPRVIEALGSPIKPGYFVSGSINTANDSGTCDIAVPVSGPKGKAKIYVTGTKERGRWSYSKMILTPETGAEIDLLSEESPSTTPPAS